MTVVVDASVAMKWVLAEDGSEDAERLLLGDPLLAPDLLLIECANVLWVKVRRGVLGRDAASRCWAALRSIPVVLFPNEGYVAAAQSIAFDIDRTVYDSLYLALAIAERAVLVTADRQFAGAARQHGVYAAAVRLLGGT